MTASTATVDLSTKTPVEIDRVLAPLWERATKIVYYLMRVEADLAKKDQPHYWRREDSEKEHRKLCADLAKVRTEAKPFEEEYARRPWRRYYLVTNASGHVHRGTNCTTCFPSTTYAWLVDLAGCDESAMIVEYGEKACTICFPSAPTHPAFRGPGRHDADAKAKRTEEKAARAAVKSAKAITAPDGSPLVIQNGHNKWGAKVTTKVAARNKLSELVRDLYSTTQYHAKKIGEDRARGAAPQADGSDAEGNRPGLGRARGRRDRPRADRRARAETRGGRVEAVVEELVARPLRPEGRSPS